MYNKYKRLVLEGSNDGVNWVVQEPLQYKRGDVIEEDSKDCGGYGGVTQNRWVEIYGEYICINNDKYQKLKKQYLDTATGEWVDVEPLETMQGQLIEQNSAQCGYGEQWVDTGDWGCKEVEVPITYFKVHPTTDGNGAIHISPSLESYPSGTNITISNTPYNNYVFSKYIYGLTENYEYTENNSVFNLNVNSDWYIKALFSESKPAPECNLYYSYYNGTQSWIDWSRSTITAADNNGETATRIIDNCGVITTIPDNAFYYSNTAIRLKEIRMPSCTYIGHYAFERRTGLQIAYFPMCEEIDFNGFNGCYNLSIVNFDRLKTIGSSVFAGCDALQKTEVFPMLQFIGYRAFAGCDGFSYISLPNAIQISSHAFIDNVNATYIDLPKCKNIYESAFNNGRKISEVSIPLCETVGGWAFKSCYSLTTILLPKVSYLGSGTFSSCSNLRSVYLTSTSMVSFNSFTFYGCNSNLSIYVPESLYASYRLEYSNKGVVLSDGVSKYLQSIIVTI